MEDAHTKSVEEILSFFNTDEETGLTDEQIQRAQEKYGPNGRLPLTPNSNSNVVNDYL